MRNSIGDNITLTLFGESHGPYVGATIDGLASGIKINEEFIKSQLDKRRPSLETDTKRIEPDNYQFVSGIFNGYTTGAPLTIIIPNENVKSNDYDPNTIRPSHADYVSHIKYNGYQDYRGGGHFSGRVTTPIVALGAIAIDILKKKGISIATHILHIGKVNDKDIETTDELDIINSKIIPTINNIEEDINSEIKTAQEMGDSIGGIIQTGIIGLPAGIGEPWFSSLEGVISNAVFSIGGIKGIEFGKGFGFKDGYGSSLNDAFTYKEDKVITKTNNNGGINGGISNGMPIIFNMAVKPTPSIYKEQDSINLENKENIKINLKGRHDPAIIRRICVVISSIVALVLVDELTKQYGRNYLN